MNYKLIYQTSEGQIEFSIDSGYIIEKFDSPTNQNVKMNTSTGARSIGDKLESQQVEGKIMTIRGVLMGDAAAKRKKMLHIIAPLMKGTLIFNDKYTLDVYPKETPTVERYSDHPAFSFILYAPYPYWRTKDGSTVMLLGLQKHFRFPWNISDPSPFRFSTFTKTAYTNVYNAGDAPTQWKATILAKTALRNPVVENITTGDYVKVFCTLDIGEQLCIDTRGDEITVTLIDADGVETDGFMHLDINSTAFVLGVGDNLIRTGADGESYAMYATMEYRTNVAGV